MATSFIEKVLKIFDCLFRCRFGRCRFSRGRLRRRSFRRRSVRAAGMRASLAGAAAWMRAAATTIFLGITVSASTAMMTTFAHARTMTFGIGAFLDLFLVFDNEHVFAFVRAFRRFQGLGLGGAAAAAALRDTATALGFYRLLRVRRRADGLAVASAFTVVLALVVPAAVTAAFRTASLAIVLVLTVVIAVVVMFLLFAFAVFVVVTFFFSTVFLTIFAIAAALATAVTNLIASADASIVVTGDLAHLLVDAQAKYG